VIPNKRVAIYGAGGFAREVAWLLSGDGMTDVVCFINDADGPTTLHGIPVVRLEDVPQDCRIAIGVGDPKTREALAAKCQGRKFATCVHHSVEMSKYVEHGEGVVICAGSILTVDITLGRHVHINLDCTVGHDARIGDFSTIAPGVHVSGNVHIGKRVYIGTGANIINGEECNPLVIEDDCVIAAGATIIGSTDGPGLYAGVPAVKKIHRLNTRTP
jgi:sugar O-acyltransferase (sialic acid O-acetyltransferase NeuD family)